MVEIAVPAGHNRASVFGRDRGEKRNVYQSLIVIDDFYPDPEEVRRTALGCGYPEVSGPPTFPGRNSRQKFTPQGMDQAWAGGCM